LPGFLGPGSGNYAADIATVLSAMGLPLSLVPNWERQIQTESGGNLRAVNLTDSNAAAGHPSVGLLQLIPGTFAAYAGPYLRTPPLVNYGGGFVSLDPMAQIYAGIHYADARYDGSMASVIGHGHGYALGTASASPGWAWVGERGPELVRFRGGEQVRPVPGGGNTYNITVNVPVGAHPAQAGKEVIRVIREYENVNGAGWRALPP
jgi:SLT domain-containing protein